MNLILITNGTVIPDAELLEALQHPKVGVRISDYGKISKKEQLLTLFEENQIRYWIQLQKWYELSAFHREALSGEGLKSIINDCCKLNSGNPHMVDGKLFRCPIQAHLHRLGIYISPERDYIDLRNPNNLQLQEQISRFMDVKHTAPMVQLCYHCNDRGYSGIEVPAAEQLAPGEKIQVRFE